MQASGLVCKWGQNIKNDLANFQHTWYKKNWDAILNNTIHDGSRATFFNLCHISIFLSPVWTMNNEDTGLGQGCATNP